MRDAFSIQERIEQLRTIQQEMFYAAAIHVQPSTSTRAYVVSAHKHELFGEIRNLLDRTIQSTIDGLEEDLLLIRRING
jgi:hypothetical protein